jgi:zinc protease
VSLSSPDRRVAEVANALLGGGYSARLNQEVRIRRGLSYGASSSAESHGVGGLVTASTQTSHPNAARVATLMRDELLRIGNELAEVAELDARKATLVGSFARQMDTTAGLASLVASQWFQGQPMSELSRYTEQVLAVTPEQVREFAHRRWTADSLRTAITTDPQAAGTSLDAVAEGALRVPHASLDLERVGLGAQPR